MPETTPRLYGIPNCDSVRRARKWLADAGVAYEFVDLKKSPPERTTVERWIKAHGWQTVINRAGTTYRALAQAQRPVDDDSAMKAIADQPTVVKRPVLEIGHRSFVGFSPEQYEKLFERGTA